MARVRLFHWHQGEAEERAARLRDLGFAVDARPLPDMTAFRALRQDPPDAFVVDLTRLPSHGREVGVALRQGKATRQVPLLFVGGAADKVARVREVLPDAVFTSWDRVDRDLAQALANPPAVRVVPASIMDAYAGTPLPRKLGVKPGSVTILDGAPDGFELTLGELPAGATVVRDGSGPRAVTLWFVRTRAELEEGIAAHAALSGWVWVAWPKQRSGIATDLTQQTVREVGLAAGLVDSKVCRVDETWAALRFSRRKRPVTPRPACYDHD